MCHDEGGLASGLGRLMLLHLQSASITGLAINRDFGYQADALDVERIGIQ